MPDERTVGVPSLIRQQQIIDEIAISLPERVQVDWSKLEFHERRLSMYAEAVMYVTHSDGATGTALAPRGTSHLLKELRSLMYQEDVGTWFSATWVITKGDAGDVAADASFNYDNEPDWDDDIHPGLYGIDLEDFPRSEENIPEWLSSLLAAAEKAEEDKNAKQ